LFSSSAGAGSCKDASAFARALLLRQRADSLWVERWLPVKTEGHVHYSCYLKHVQKSMRLTENGARRASFSSKVFWRSATLATCRSKYTGVKKTKQTKACDHVELRGEFLSLTRQPAGDQFVGQVRDHAESGQMKPSNLEDIKPAWEKETMNSTLRAASLSFRIFSVRAA